MSEEFARALLSYLPGYLIHQAVTTPSLIQWEQRSSAAVLVADISGFTSLAEALAQAGRRGSEELSGILNHHFSTMVNLVHGRGGDVTQFSGDAITAIFLPGDAPDLGEAIRRAAACALAIQGHVATAAVLRTSQGAFPLQIRIGIGAGPAYTAVVGDEAIGFLHLLAGPARERAARAQRLARPGEVVLSSQARRLVGDAATLTRTRWGYARITAMPQSLVAASWPTRGKEIATLPPERLAELAAFLPPTLCQRIDVSGRDFIGEHRYVVILFVGFRGLDFARDREAGAKLRAYTTAVQQVVDQYDGHLCDVEIGDKGNLLLIRFGAPRAHEDDEERAILCALAMQERVHQADLGFITGQRIGVSAGLLFAGSIGGDDRWAYTTVGDEVNLASRLMEQAEWGQVVTSARVRRRVGERGQFTSLGQVTVKGKAAPVPIFELGGVRERPTTLAARWLLYKGKIVGREAEIHRLQQIAQRALDGAAQVLIIQGEAGLGKSRLAGELIRWWLDREGQGASGDCLSYTRGVPYHPWSELLPAVLGLQPDPPAGERALQVETHLRQIDPDLSTRLPLLAEILGIPFPDNEITRHLEGPARKRGLFSTVLEIVCQQTLRRPHLLLFEDIHWSDLPSLELIEYLARNAADRPVLLVLAHRPLDEPLPAPYQNLIQLPHSHLVTLGALPATGTETLALARLGLPPGITLPAEIQTLLQRAQGNPLFVEEILNALEDAGVRVIQANGHGIIQGNLTTVEIPQTVQGLVQARIDRLDEGSRFTLKVASVIGREVPCSALQEIYPLEIDPERLGMHLSTLERADLLRQESSTREPSYFFKHIITREVAYESLLFTQRQTLHRAMGRHLEAAHADNPDEAVDLLAHHYHLSGDQAKAFTYLMQAGDRAVRAYTNREALVYYRQAQRWLEEDDWTQWWDYLQRLEKVLDVLGLREEQWQILREMEHRARAQGDVQHLADARHRQGALLAQTGHPAEGIVVLQEAAALARKAADLSLAGHCAIQTSRAYWLQWDFIQSRQALEQAQQLFRLGDDPEGEAATLTMLGNLYLTINPQYERALETYRQASQIYRSLSDVPGESLARVHEAIALLSLGAVGPALQVIRPAQSFCEHSGDLFLMGLVWFARGHALMRLEDYESALEAARRCLTLMEESQERNFLLEAVGLVGRILLRQGRAEEALPHFRQACTLAQAGGQDVDVFHFRSFEALALLRSGQERAALESSNKVIAFLEDWGEQIDDLQHIYFHHFLILSQIHGPQAGQPYLERAYQIVQEIAGDIRDPDLRHSFLEGLQGNREIIAAWKALS